MRIFYDLQINLNLMGKWSHDETRVAKSLPKNRSYGFATALPSKLNKWTGFIQQYRQEQFYSGQSETVFSQTSLPFFGQF